MENLTVTTNHPLLINTSGIVSIGSSGSSAGSTIGTVTPIPGVAGSTGFPGQSGSYHYKTYPPVPVTYAPGYLDDILQVIGLIEVVRKLSDPCTAQSLVFCCADYKFYKGTSRFSIDLAKDVLEWREVTLDKDGQDITVPVKSAPVVLTNPNDIELFDVFEKALALEELPVPTIKSVQDLPADSEERYVFNKTIIEQRLEDIKLNQQIADEIAWNTRKTNGLLANTFTNRFTPRAEYFTAFDPYQPEEKEIEKPEPKIESKKTDSEPSLWEKIKRHFSELRNSYKLAGTPFE